MVSLWIVVIALIVAVSALWLLSDGDMRRCLNTLDGQCKINIATTDAIKIRRQEIWELQRIVDGVPQHLGHLDYKVSSIESNIKLIMDHLGLEFFTTVEQRIPSQTVIRPKIERGEG